MLLTLTSFILTILLVDSLENFYGLHAFQARMIVLEGIFQMLVDFSFWLYVGLGAIAVTIVLLATRRLVKKKRSIVEKHGSNILRSIPIVLIFFWFYSIILWSNAFVFDNSPPPYLYYSMDIPFFFYSQFFFAVKFGVMGLLAFFGLWQLSSSRERGFYISVLTWLWALILSSFWWGSRTLVYGLFPMAVLASAGFLLLMKKSGGSFTYQNTSNQKMPKSRIVIALVISSTLVLSSLSYIQTVVNLSLFEASWNSVADSTTWIYSNLPTNSTLFLSDFTSRNFILNFGFKSTIPTHHSFSYEAEQEANDDWVTLIESNSPSTVCSILRKWNVTHALIAENPNFAPDSFMKEIVDNSKVLYEGASSKVLALITPNLTNILPNHSFENGDVLPYNWTALRTDEHHRAIWDNTNSHCGNYSIKLSVDPSSGETWVRWESSWLPLNATLSLYLELYLKQNITTSAGALVQLDVYNDSRELLEYHRIWQKGNTDWAIKSTRVALPVGSAWVKVILVNRGEGDTWYDCVKLYYITAAFELG